MNRRERMNEDQCYFFGFSPMALGDDVFNEVVGSWERQVDKLLDTPQWSKLKGDKRARAALINLMFQKGFDASLVAMADQISEYAHLNVFKISNNVILPGTEPLQQMGSVDTDELRRRVVKAERRVEEAKKRAALLRHEKQDVNERFKVIRELARQLGYVKKDDSSMGDTTMRTSLSPMKDDNGLEESSMCEENKENDEGDRTVSTTRIEDTVSMKDSTIEEGEEDIRDKTITGESMEDMMERSLTMED